MSISIKNGYHLSFQELPQTENTEKLPESDLEAAKAAASKQEQTFKAISQIPFQAGESLAPDRVEVLPATETAIGQASQSQESVDTAKAMAIQQGYTASQEEQLEGLKESKVGTQCFSAQFNLNSLYVYILISF